MVVQIVCEQNSVFPACKRWRKTTENHRKILNEQQHSFNFYRSVKFRLHYLVNKTLDGAISTCKNRTLQILMGHYYAYEIRLNGLLFCRTIYSGYFTVFPQKKIQVKPQRISLETYQFQNEHFVG